MFHEYMFLWGIPWISVYLSISFDFSSGKAKRFRIYMAKKRNKIGFGSQIQKFQSHMDFIIQSGLLEKGVT